MEPPPELPLRQRTAWTLMLPGELSDAEVAAHPQVGVTDRTVRAWRAAWREEYGFTGLENRPAVIQEVAEQVAATWVERRARMALEAGATAEMLLVRMQALIPTLGTTEIVYDEDTGEMVERVGIDGKGLKDSALAAAVLVDKADMLSVGIGQASGQAGGGVGNVIGVTVNVGEQTREELIAAERAHAQQRQMEAIEARTNGTHPPPDP